MKKIICKIFGCDWRYNFPSIPSKCICKRCHAKSKLNLNILQWEFADSFGDKRSDEELINQWSKM